MSVKYTTNKILHPATILVQNIRTCQGKNKILVKVSGTLQVIQKQQWALEICRS